MTTAPPLWALPAARALEGETRPLITRLSIAVSLVFLMCCNCVFGQVMAASPRCGNWSALDAQRRKCVRDFNAALAAEVQDLNARIAVVEGARDVNSA